MPDDFAEDTESDRCTENEDRLLHPGDPQRLALPMNRSRPVDDVVDASFALPFDSGGEG